MNFRQLLEVFKESFREFGKDKVPRLAAALAYFALFSLAPLLVIAIAVAGFAFGEEAARGEIVGQIEGVIGETGGKAIQEMIRNAGQQKQKGVLATIAALIALLFGASGVFGQLKDTMNTVWGVEEKREGGIVSMIRQRFWSFAMVLGVGFLLLTSLIISAALAAAGTFMEGRLPGGATLWQIVTFAVSFAIITLLMALIFKYIPDAEVGWGDVWLGAAFTAFLFVLGKFGIGFYLGKSTVASTYGAAASIIIVILWLYYSGLILFFGSEFTEVYSRHARGAATGSGPRARTRRGPAGSPGPGRIHTGKPSAPLPVPETSAAKRRERAAKKGGLGSTVAAGFGGIVIGVLLGVIAVVFAAVKSVTKIFR
ncbi:MAG TPA: YihY/virulence factor BrkB family protein [Thermoanaerobaculia bacterium]|nr:YihY/virulence factor BrkB family protein [Thermoanaerobaculia bacterium]